MEENRTDGDMLSYIHHNLPNPTEAMWVSIRTNRLQQQVLRYFLRSWMESNFAFYHRGYVV